MAGFPLVAIYPAGLSRTCGLPRAERRMGGPRRTLAQSEAVGLAVILVYQGALDVPQEQTPNVWTEWVRESRRVVNELASSRGERAFAEPATGAAAQPKPQALLDIRNLHVQFVTSHG